MKIECIKTHDYITVGKIYEIIRLLTDGDYIIINDNGNEDWFPKKWFKPISEI